MKILYRINQTKKLVKPEIYKKKIFKGKYAQLFSEPFDFWPTNEVVCGFFPSGIQIKRKGGNSVWWLFFFSGPGKSGNWKRCLKGDNHDWVATWENNSILSFCRAPQLNSWVSKVIPSRLSWVTYFNMGKNFSPIKTEAFWINLSCYYTIKGVKVGVEKSA